MNSATFSDRCWEEPYRPYLIAEIGINHNGDIEIAKKLIDAAYATGWDCVKFQKRNPDICVPEGVKNMQRETPWGSMKYIDYKKKIEYSEKEYDFIDAYCKYKPIEWSASIWDFDSLEFISNYKVPFIKIPSAMITNIKLIEGACNTGLPIILSTGMSLIDEIDSAVEVLDKYSTDYTLLHCVSTYPADIVDLNLKMIETLQSRYGCKVGYSGHEYGLNPSVTAVHMGATVLERHITLDRNMWGTDQSASMEPHAMDLLVKRILEIPIVIGDGKKILSKGEEIVRKKLSG